MRRVWAAKASALMDRFDPSRGRDTVRTSPPESIPGRLAVEEIGVTRFYCGCGVEAHEEGNARLLPPPSNGDEPQSPPLTTRLSLEQQLQLLERRIIEDSLRRNNYRRSDTARELGISRVTLYNKMKKLGILLKPRNHPTEANRRQ